jgi:hypothetical protein
MYHIGEQRQPHPELLIVYVQVRDRNALLVRAEHVLRLALVALEQHEPPDLDVLQLRQCAVLAHGNERLPCLCCESVQRRRNGRGQCVEDRHDVEEGVLEELEEWTAQLEDIVD